MNILRIDASARITGSTTRQLTDRIVARLTEGAAADQPLEVIERDLAQGLPLLDEASLQAMWTDEAQRTPEQAARLSLADGLIAELQAADAVVIGLPIYNFGVPAAFKAWIDLVARARVTFRYTANGPVGLLADRPVYVAIASGGTALGGAADFVSGWLRHVLAFLGLCDVRLIDASGQMLNAGAVERAEAQVDALLPAPTSPSATRAA